jgi:hypothetical protein
LSRRSCASAANVSEFILRIFPKYRTRVNLPAGQNWSGGSAADTRNPFLTPGLRWSMGQPRCRLGRKAKVRTGRIPILVGMDVARHEVARSALVRSRSRVADHPASIEGSSVTSFTNSPIHLGLPSIAARTHRLFGDRRTFRYLEVPAR